MSDFEALPLREIHLPDPVGWWPPAPGWWLLALLTLILTVLAYVLLQRWRKRGRWSRQATTELQAIEHRYRQDADVAALIRDLSGLIRRSAMSQAGRGRIAGLSGQAWLDWLDGVMGDGRFQEGSGLLIVEAAWQADPKVSPDQAEDLIGLTRDWLRRLPERTVDTL